jgi:hypothetical protein
MGSGQLAGDVYEQRRPVGIDARGDDRRGEHGERCLT